MINGILKDNLRKRKFHAITRLGPEDVKLIASVAKSENNLKSQITWLRTCPELHKEYRKAVKVHDNLLVKSPAEQMKEGWVMLDQTVDQSERVVEDITKYFAEGRKRCPAFQSKSELNALIFFWSY